MKILFTDSQIIDRGDIDWKPIEDSGTFYVYENITKEEAKRELCDAEAVFIDGFRMDSEMIGSAPSLRFIGVAATGYDNVDVAFAREKGIAVYNVPAYSTEAVAQHTFALILGLAGRITGYDRQVKDRLWSREEGSRYEPLHMTRLQGKSLGIIGYGNIGRKVAQIAQAFGMDVNVYSEDPDPAIGSDVLSLHCPLTDDNAGMVDEIFISRMKDGAILINTARGGLVDTGAVAEALRSGKLSGYGADVMSPEPPDPNDPILDAPNCIITPHIAFTPVETRQKVVDVCGENLEAFLKGSDKNRVG